MFEVTATTTGNGYKNLLVTVTLAGLMGSPSVEPPKTRQTDPPVYEHADTMSVKMKEDLAWFYSDEWQAMEDEADEDYRAGRMKSYDSVSDLLASL